jgi:hypothetical protein
MRKTVSERMGEMEDYYDHRITHIMLGLILGILLSKFWVEPILNVLFP